MNGKSMGNQGPRNKSKNRSNGKNEKSASQGRQGTAKLGDNLTVPANLRITNLSGASSEASFSGSEDTIPSITTAPSIPSKPIDQGQTERKPPGPELTRAEPPEPEPTASPELEATTTMIVHANTGPVFDISVTTPIFVHSISFEKTCKAPQPMKVKSKSLKKKLFQKLFEKTSFKAEFSYDKDEVSFDGNDKLFSKNASSLGLNEYRVLGFGFTQPTVTYQVRIKFVAKITPEISVPKSDDDWDHVGSLAKLLCNGLEVTAKEAVKSAIQSEEPSLRGLSYTDKALATMKNTKTSTQLAVTAVPCISLPKADLLDLIEDFNGETSPVTLVPYWLVRNLIGLQVTRRNEDQKIDATKYRIVGIGKPAKETDGIGRLVWTSAKNRS